MVGNVEKTSLLRGYRAPSLLVVGLVLLVNACGAAAQTGPHVAINAGQLTGKRSDGVDSFLGIPYARQPVGDLRWREPQPVEQWSGTRDARHYGAACVQPEDRFSHHTPENQSEACLFLNVWAPVKRKASLPVMVWLHGGAHRIGAGSLPFYNGTQLAKRGVVVVTINYRLGYLGYFAHKALADQGGGGNYGLMDQVKALHWVQNNIAAFGGDPDRVTLFGESAGGADVLYMMTSPVAKSLFSAAIVESGGGWGKPPTLEKMQASVREDLKSVDIPPDAGAKTLRDLDARTLIKAQEGNRDLGFGPFLDGKTVFKVPSDVFAAHNELPIPLIIGSNSWEANLLKHKDLGLKGWLVTILPAIHGWYSGHAGSARERRDYLFRDAVFAAPARWVAAKHSKTAPSWLYWFDYVGSWHRDKVRGAGHGSELIFAFDTVETLPELKGATSTEDLRIGRQMADCWAAFAKRHQPNCSMADWQRYQSDKDNVLLIDRNPRQTKHPEGDVLDGVRGWFGPGAWLGP